MVAHDLRELSELLRTARFGRQPILIPLALAVESHVMEMEHRQRRKWLYAAIVVVLTLNVWLILWRIQSSTSIPSGTHQERLDEQMNRLTLWRSDPGVPITNRANWEAVINNMPQGGCMDMPEHVTPAISEELAPADLAALFDAVVGLLTVYVEDSPELLIRYMAEHGEKPRPQSIEALRTIVADMRGESPPAVRRLSSEQVLIAFWKESGTASRWAKILERSACYQIWRSRELPSDELRDSLANRDSRVFQNIVKTVHQFEPVRPLTEILNADGSLLFADIKVVVQLSSEVDNNPVPYYFRFWHDSIDGIWHPYQMNHVRVERESNGPSHLF